MSEHRACNPCQQWRQIKPGDQPEEKRLRETHHNRLAGCSINGIVQLQRDWLTLQQTPENSGSATLAGITVRTSGRAAEPDMSPAALNPYDSSLLLNHAGKTQGSGSGKSDRFGNFFYRYCGHITDDRYHQFIGHARESMGGSQFADTVLDAAFRLDAFNVNRDSS